jgi:hypothetical protein
MSVPKNLKKRKKERGRRERLLEDWPLVEQMIDASYASWGLFPQIFRGFLRILLHAGTWLLTMI